MNNFIKAARHVLRNRFVKQSAILQGTQPSAAKPLPATTAKAFQLLMRGLRHTGVSMPKTTLALDHPLLGPTAVRFADNSYSVQDSSPNIAILTHELGHIKDFSKMQPASPHMNLLSIIPTVGDFRTIRNEIAANRESWKFLQELYKDNPEILKEFSKLRWRTLTPAFGTYLAKPGATIGGGLLGGWLGRRKYDKKMEKYRQELEDIENSNDSPEEKKKRIEKLRKPSLLLHHLTGAGIGALTGRILLSAPIIMALKAMMGANDAAGSAKLLNMMEADARTRGFKPWMYKSTTNTITE